MAFGSGVDVSVCPRGQTWNPTSGGDGLWFLVVLLLLRMLQPFLAALKPFYLLLASWGVGWWAGYWCTLSSQHRCEHTATLSRTVADTARQINTPTDMVLSRFQT